MTLSYSEISIMQNSKVTTVVTFSFNGALGLRRYFRGFATSGKLLLSKEDRYFRIPKFVCNLG